MADLPLALASAVEDLRRRYPSAAAIVFYGSCLRDRSSDGLLDFYVLVDRYRDVMGYAAALGAHVLPPNVYRHSLGDLRAKVAVMRVDDFLHGLGAGWFTPMLSARFAQPCAVVHVRGRALQDRLSLGFLAAADTCIARTLPLMPRCFTARELWQRIFTESFATELRPESAERIASLVENDPAFYEALTRRVLGNPEDGMLRHAVPAHEYARAVVAWRARRVVGKTLNALRLLKAAFTFQGGLRYAAWKIVRHRTVS